MFKNMSSLPGEGGKGWRKWGELERAQTFANAPEALRPERRDSVVTQEHRVTPLASFDGTLWEPPRMHVSKAKTAHPVTTRGPQIAMRGSLSPQALVSWECMPKKRCLGTHRRPSDKKWGGKLFLGKINLCC